LFESFTLTNNPAGRAAGEEVMSTAPRYIPHYTAADYEQWEGDWELWQGIPVAMTPSPFGPHQNCSFRIARSLWAAIEAAKCESVVLQDVDWIISDDTIVRPDVVVLCGEVPEQHITQSPALAVEILSPSTASRDRNQKRDLYQDNGVDYYLIVDPDDNTFELYERNEQGEFQQRDPADAYDFTLCNDCHIRLERASIF
jgi:Uma2 family endonuclease